jgi:hypothetical protein
MSSLPAHASMVTLGCEAAGTRLSDRKQQSEGNWLGWYGEEN